MKYLFALSLLVLLSCKEKDKIILDPPKEDPIEEEQFAGVT